MPFSELRGYAREVFLEQKIEELEKVYRKAQKELKRRLDNIDLTNFQKARTEALLVQVNQELVALNVAVRKWTKKNLDIAYEHGLDIAQERLQKMGVTKYVNFDARIHRTAVSVLINDVTVDFVTANQSIKNNVTRFIRTTQQRILEDAQISRMVAQGIVQGETRRAISDNILNAFRERMDNEQFITINGRNFRPDKYSRLVARTRFVEASNRASINASLQYGVDLVQVSVHSHQQDDPCSPYQGKIYSISGGDPDFPPLTVTPPYHPNCKHQLLPITKESLEERGLLENSVRFSQSKREVGVRSFTEFEEEINV